MIDNGCKLYKISTQRETSENATCAKISQGEFWFKFNTTNSDYTYFLIYLDATLLKVNIKLCKYVSKSQSK